LIHMARTKLISGVDIGSSKIATIIASLDDGEENIRVLGSSSINSRGVRKGQVVNIDEATGAIIDSVEAAERMAGYNIADVYVSVGGQHIASQNSKGVVAIAEPEEEISEEDVRRVIEAAKAISLPSSREIIDVVTRNFNVDGQEGIADPVGMSGIRLEVETHIVTGSTTAIKNLTKCISEVGANITGRIATASASAEAVLSETEKELGVILVDLGGGTTSSVIFIEGSPVFTSVIPVGARNITNDLAIGLRLPLEVAEKVKVFIGGETKVSKSKNEKELKKSHNDDDELDLTVIEGIDEAKKVSKKTLIEGIIRPRLNEIFSLVGVEIKKSGFGGMTPSGIVLCGGGAMTAGIVDSARRTLSLPVRVGTPKGVVGLVDDILSPEFATLVGLIKYALKRRVEPSNRLSLGRISGVLRKIPVHGLANRTLNLIKSLLP